MTQSLDLRVPISCSKNLRGLSCPWDAVKVWDIAQTLNDRMQLHIHAAHMLAQTCCKLSR